jgi:hypothetical protein
MMKGLAISAGDIVPSDVQERLESVGGQGDTTEWDLGDIVVEYFDLYWEDVKAEIAGITKGAVYNAIGQFCSRKGQTIRDYERVSRSVPVKLREEFDMLGRHHHRVIIPYSKGDAGEHKKICMWALQQSDQYGGNLIPVHALAAALKDMYAPAPDPSWKQRLERIRAQIEKLIGEPEAPPEVQECAKVALSQLSDNFIQMQKSLENMGTIALPPGTEIPAWATSVILKPGKDPVFKGGNPPLMIVDEKPGSENLGPVVEPILLETKDVDPVNDW